MFSIQTITALVEVVTGGGGLSHEDPIGIYRSGPTLEQFLGAAGIELRIGSNSRVPSVRGALTTPNKSDPNSIIRLIEQVADPREYIHCPEREGYVVEYLNAILRGDGYELQKLGQKYKLLPYRPAGSVATCLSEAAMKLSFESVQKDFDRGLSQAESDPEDAITAACSTLESVCKCLLDEMSEAYPAKQDIIGLVKAVNAKLNLSPSRTDIEGDIKHILGGLTNVSAGIGVLRTHCGDAHGRGKPLKRVDSRIARLAIHAASTVAIFLIETWQKRSPQDST
jgi:hypothetical protein